MRNKLNETLRYVALGSSLLLGLGTYGCATCCNGVTEINQAQAQAGDTTPGDGQGFPITISKPGSYRLTSNLDLSGLPDPVYSHEF